MGELKDLQKAVVKFRDDRDWLQFHTPKNLAQALASEVGELNDLFLWSRDPDWVSVGHEMADIAIYLLSIADVTGIDLKSAIKAKLVLNERKYPVNHCRGNDKKAEAR